MAPVATPCRAGATIMAASNLDDGAGRPLPSVAGRLRDGRWGLGIIAVVLIILFAVDAVSLVGALIVFFILAAALVAAPRPNAAERVVSRSEPAEPVWPETGIKRFAEALPDPCFVLDRRGIVRFANERALV